MGDILAAHRHDGNYRHEVRHKAEDFTAYLHQFMTPDEVRKLCKDPRDLVELVTKVCLEASTAHHRRQMKTKFLHRNLKHSSKL